MSPRWRAITPDSWWSTPGPLWAFTATPIVRSANRPSCPSTVLLNEYTRADPAPPRFTSCYGLGQERTERGGHVCIPARRRVAYAKLILLCHKVILPAADDRMRSRVSARAPL